MSDSLYDEPFYAPLGIFASGYNRDEAEAGMREAFRARQRQRHQQFVEERMLGAGLGRPAEGTVRAGIYEPQTVLTRASAEEETETETKTQTETGTEAKGEAKGEANVEKSGGASRAPSRVVQRYGGLEVEVRSLAEVHAQLDANLRVAEQSIAHGCSPFTFDDLLHTLEAALCIAEEGDATRVVRLPTRASVLRGAEAVMDYVHENILPIASDLVTVLYATAWMLQYTTTFVDALIATNMEEAQMRLELLAHCVRWLGKIDQFISLSLAVELQWNAYNSFRRMREAAELHIGELIDSVQTDLGELLQSVKFPRRRDQLLAAEKGITTRLRRAVTLLNEIDCGFAPHVQLQVQWKDEFLTRMLSRVYTGIAPAHFSASMGFIDESLYAMSNGTRRVSFVRNPKFRSSITAADSLRAALYNRKMPTVSTATRVRNYRVDDGYALQQIGAIFGTTASCVVGLQLCMGARYVLRQCSPAYDAQWGFSMNEPEDSPGLEREAALTVTKFINAVTKKVRRRLPGMTPGDRVTLFS